MKKTLKTILKIVLVIVVLLVVALIAMYNIYRKDPNILLTHFTTPLKLDEAKDIKFKYDSSMVTGRKTIPVFMFDPEDDSPYRFTISNIETDEGVHLSMNVCDIDLNDYIYTEQVDDNGDLTGTEYFSSGTKCFVIVSPVAMEEKEKYSGSFTIEVTRSTEDELTKAKVAEPSYLTVRQDEKTSLMFTPPETGFYRFTASIESKDEKSGYAYIDSIKTGNNDEVKQSGGICWLEKDKFYYIWVSTNDLINLTANVSVVCDKLDTIDVDSPSSNKISDDTIIVFKAPESGNYAVYSQSDGKTVGSVYDERGFMLNYDEDSGGPLSGNKNDYALILQAEKGDTYIIYSGGTFNDCNIVITGYKGDGSSLGPEDIEPLKQDEEKDENKNGEITEEKAEEKTEDKAEDKSTE